MSEKKIIFPKDVVIGKYYKVPHVWSDNFFGKKGYIPINTPVHDDKDYINFAQQHFHCDWRFLSGRDYKSICSDRFFEHCELRAEVSKVILTFNGDIHYKIVLAKRNYANDRYFKILETPVMEGQWRKKLQDAFCGDHLRQNEHGQYVCPHKGAIIDLKHIDENGHAVCPAHLLRFNTETLKAI